MKLFRFYCGENIHVAALTEAGAVDLTLPGLAPDMNALIQGGEPCLAAIRDALSGGALPAFDPAGIRYANVTVPQKIVCEGLNYKDHAEETGGEAPPHPVLFSKFNDALAPSGAQVTLPPWQRCYDYEAELVIVVGRPAYNVSPQEAEDCIFGYTCGNDLSARDAQFLSAQWLSGKSFPGFAPAGPYIVTRDSFDPYMGHRISCRVNGETVQDGSTADMIFGCRETLSAASRFFRLAPGDLIFTGTPAGVILGKPKNTRVWLKPGDTVAVEIGGIGELATELI